MPEVREGATTAYDFPSYFNVDGQAAYRPAKRDGRT